MKDDKAPIAIPSLKGRDGLERPLPQRFYKAVDVAPRGTGFAVMLDTRVARTPKKIELVAPSKVLAEALAAEWAAQAGKIDPATMPMTRLANTALDGVAGREADVRADIVKYSASDLVCYRADRPPGLVTLQCERWDPVVAWAKHTLSAPIAVTTGIVHVPQPAKATRAIASAVAGLDAWRLACLHVMTTLTGSALIALKHSAGALTPEQAWTAAHIDEDWQISQWGTDAEATARRAARHGEMAAASRMLALL